MKNYAQFTLLEKSGDYYTFEDLKFGPHPNLYHYDNSKHTKMVFDNGCSVSVIFGDLFYSDGVSTYEMAAFDRNGNFIWPEQVKGYLDRDQVTQEMINIQKIPKKKQIFSKEDPYGEEEWEDTNESKSEDYSFIPIEVYQKYRKKLGGSPVAEYVDGMIKRLINKHISFTDANGRLITGLVDKIKGDSQGCLSITVNNKHYDLRFSKPVTILDPEEFELRKKRKEELRLRYKEVDPYGEEEWEDINESNSENNRYYLCINDTNEHGTKMNLTYHKVYKDITTYSYNDNLIHVINDFGKKGAYSKKYFQKISSNNIKQIEIELKEIERKKEIERLKHIDIDPYGEENWGNTNESLFDNKFDRRSKSFDKLNLINIELLAKIDTIDDIIENKSDLQRWENVSLHRQINKFYNKFFYNVVDMSRFLLDMVKEIKITKENSEQNKVDEIIEKLKILEDLFGTKTYNMSHSEITEIVKHILTYTNGVIGFLKRLKKKYEVDYDIDKFVILHSTGKYYGIVRKKEADEKRAKLKDAHKDVDPYGEEQWEN